MKLPIETIIIILQYIDLLNLEKLFKNTVHKMNILECTSAEQYMYDTLIKLFKNKLHIMQFFDKNRNKIVSNLRVDDWPVMINNKYREMVDPKIFKNHRADYKIESGITYDHYRIYTPIYKCNKPEYMGKLLMNKYIHIFDYETTEDGLFYIKINNMFVDEMKELI
jgi:hypothetical protein